MHSLILQMNHIKIKSEKNKKVKIILNTSSNE